MKLVEVYSHGEMLDSFVANSKNYVLLYKKGSESSECSFNSIEEALNDGSKVNIVAANVVDVRDIHEAYDVTTVPSLLVFQGDKFERTVKGCNDDGYYKSLFESALFSAKQSDNNKSQKRVTVYSTPTCSWCTTLKTHLKKNGIQYSEVDVSNDQNAAQEMKRKSGQQGVPQTDINGEMIVGFDKIKINRLLDIQ